MGRVMEFGRSGGASRAVVSALLLLSCLLVGTGVALAQQPYPPPPPPGQPAGGGEVEASCDFGTQSRTIRCQGSGFAPNAVVSVEVRAVIAGSAARLAGHDGAVLAAGPVLAYADGELLALYTVTADEVGDVLVEYSLPCDYLSDQVFLRLSGNDLNGDAIAFESVIDIEPSPGCETGVAGGLGPLPRTGAQLLGYGAVALAAIGVGTMLVRVRRLRRRPSTA